MRKFSVNVNGTKYEVEVEEIDAAAVASAAPKAEPVSASQSAGAEVRILCHWKGCRYLLRHWYLESC